MKYIIIALSIIVIGCAVSPQAQTQDVVPPVKPDTITINVPNWPVFLYQSGEAFVLLSVREPSKFPVPPEIVFKNGDQVVTMPRVQPQPTK